VHLEDGEVWQSRNEGYSWAQPAEGETVLSVYMHAYSNARAYLFTATKVWVTTDTGRSWHAVELPSPPNGIGVPILHTHPLESDWLIFVGAEYCNSNGEGGFSACQAVAYYSTKHGRDWHKFESYVRNCAWARDSDLKIDSRLILCEAYRDKKGNQLTLGGRVPLELWIGGNFFRDKRKLFNNVVGYAKFSEYLLVGEVSSRTVALDPGRSTNCLE
jgi:photosystem II stability/assembly factor-like uncharacterized protein